MSYDEASLAATSCAGPSCRAMKQPIATENRKAVWDAAIVGAGPAGASCALWLKLLGFQAIVIDQQEAAGGRLRDSPYDNSWVAVAEPGATGTGMARTMDANLVREGVARTFGARVTHLQREGGGFRLALADAPEMRAQNVVMATGLEAATGDLAPSEGVYFGPGREVFGLPFAGKRVAILGGGDNAFDHAALALRREAAEVEVFARTLRARSSLVKAVPRASITKGFYAVDTDRRLVNGQPFDVILVMYGFRPRMPQLRDLAPDTDAEGYVRTDPCSAQTSEPGLFAIGDLAARGHPSVPTALADGVAAAKAIERRLIRKP